MTVTRRQFVETSAKSLVLLIGVGQAGCRPRTTTSGRFQPNQWLRIDGEGRITVINDKSEMGQGASTAIPLIVAEELGVPWESVAVEPARPGPQFQSMGTSGSDSVADGWQRLRLAAAQAREMLVTAAAARWKVPVGEIMADRGQLTHRGSGKRASYASMVAAASRLPIPDSPPLKSSTSFTLLGTRVPRLDAALVVRGAKQFAGDLRMPGLLHATLLRSAVPGGRATKWSADRATRVPGVRAVVAVPNGIAVVALHTWAALEGRKVLEVEWSPGPGAKVDTTSLWRGLESALQHSAKDARREGNVAAGLAGAARRLTAEYRYPFQAHGAIEPLNAIARVDEQGAELWVGTQNPNRVQQDVAKLLGVPEERVVVNVLPLGGAFGRRISPDFALEAVEVARAEAVKGSPVHLMWTREDDFEHDMFQSAAIVRMAAGLDGRGGLTAWSHRIADYHLSMFGDFDPARYRPADDGEPWGGIDTPYLTSALEVQIARLTSPVRTGAWRSVFYPSSVMARECFLDEVARAMGKDPVTLRTELLTEAGAGSADRASRNRARLRNVIAVAADRAGWTHPRVDPPPTRRAGRGFSCNIYHRATVTATVAEVSVGEGGHVKVERIVVAMDCGRAVNLDGVEAQIEGGVMWALSTLFGRAITFTDGRVDQRTFQDFPVLTMDRTPKVECHILPSDLPPSGVGEQPVPGIIPAVLNAIFDATGQRIREVPLKA